MFWWPVYRPENLDSIEPDDVNEVFQNLWDEISGNLGEHNFNANSFGPEDFSVADDEAIVRVYQHTVEDSSVHQGNLAGALSYFVPRDGTWHVVGDDSVLPWEVIIDDCPPGTLEVQISCQATYSFDAGSFEIGPNLQLAIEIDGALIPETVTGTLEPSQDLRVNINGSSSGVDTSEVIESGAGRIFITQPVVLSIVTPIAAGYHTVRLLVISPVAESTALIPDQTLKYGAVKGGEILAIWMK